MTSLVCYMGLTSFKTNLRVTLSGCELSSNLSLFLSFRHRGIRLLLTADCGNMGNYKTLSNKLMPSEDGLQAEVHKSECS